METNRALALVVWVNHQFGIDSTRDSSLNCDRGRCAPLVWRVYTACFGLSATMSVAILAFVALGCIAFTGAGKPTLVIVLSLFASSAVASLFLATLYSEREAHLRVVHTEIERHT